MASTPYARRTRDILYVRMPDGRIVRRIYRTVEDVRQHIQAAVNTDDDEALKAWSDKLNEMQSAPRRALVRGMHWALYEVNKVARIGDGIQETILANLPAGEVAKARERKLRIINAAEDLLNVQTVLEAEYIQQMKARKETEKRAAAAKAAAKAAAAKAKEDEEIAAFLAADKKPKRRRR